MKLINKMIFITLGIVSFIPAAMAVECKGSIVDTTVEEIKVPEGASCYLRNVIVSNGNIQADKARSLTMHKVTVENGDVQAVEVKKIVYSDNLTVLNGNIQVSKSRYVYLRACAMVGNGDVQISENKHVDISYFRVLNGNIQVEKNKRAYVVGNNASGDIQCFENGFLLQNSNLAGGNLECVN